MRFMESQDNQHCYMDVEGIKGGEIVHVRFRQV